VLSVVIKKMTNNMHAYLGNRVLSMLDADFHTIAQQPEIGIACDYIRSGYRKHHVGRHLIFYRQSSTHIDQTQIKYEWALFICKGPANIPLGSYYLKMSNKFAPFPVSYQLKLDFLIKLDLII
jgi:hypothetical protein